ncbi:MULTISPECIES: zinc ABC transporter substrate-binding protein [unclassified Streptomyces]|uniref:metal ABC transporter solute-binding protein, Zn/Mn family n=1 Tax=unclassified Streptomyces TaxID=2593676 RepID=UPI000B85E995|nr:MULTISPECIES: zinc ABC transporter substrate-binding protein [unclassified Streptomyces]MYT14098.1 zinc ABC transporter solute-binding protein [Streptomyces sp. SID4951]
MRLSSIRGPALLMVLTLALAGGCGGASVADAPGGSRHDARSPAIPVVASTNVYGDVVEQIGGDRVKVVSLISDPAQDPHSYEASTQNRLALSKAKVVVENGGGYDDFIGRMLDSANSSSPTVIDAVQVSGKAPRAGNRLNEHVWYDLPTMGKLADRIAAALAKAAPADADAFRHNAKTFKDKLTRLEEQEQGIKAAHGGSAVAVTEPVPLYLTEASGLRNKTPTDFSESVEEGSDVSPQSLRQTLDLFTRKQVKALVYNQQTSSPETEQVKQAAEDHGIPVVPVTETLPRGQDYLSWMRANVAALKHALDT